MLSFAVVLLVLQLSTVARKLSLEPGLTWRFEYRPSRLDRGTLRLIDRLPLVAHRTEAGIVHHVGLLHAVNVVVLVGLIGVIGAGMRGLADLALVTLLFGWLAALPWLEVHEYTPWWVVGLGPMPVKVHAFSAVYAVTVTLALGAAYADGVSLGITLGIGLLFSVPFVITQAVVVLLLGHEVTEDGDGRSGPRFLVS
ncbi:MAG: hypothetical protein R3324_10630 [Halobacteriales archaeon]|nr:hypothetical protein [Halobacteriales archaeon]